MTAVKPKGSEIERLPLPLPISKQHKYLNFYIDFYFVNGYAFLATKINKVNFITAKPCISRKTSHITKDIDTVLDL